MSANEKLASIMTNLGAGYESYTHEGAWHAFWDSQGVASGTFNERMLTFINTQLGVTYTNLPRALQAYAEANSAANWDAVSSISGYTAEATALFARMTTPPTTARKQAINTFIRSLKTAGVWDKLDVLQVYAAADSQAALLNWKGSSFNASAVSSPTFVADGWFQGNGSTSYINTGITPSTAGGVATQNDMTYGFYAQSAYDTGTRGNVAWGSGFAHATGIDQILTNPEAPALRGQIGVTIGSYYQTAAQTGNYTHGLVSLVRTSSTALEYFVRGASIASSSAHTSTGILAVRMFLGGVNNNGSLTSPHTLRYSGFIFGKALSAAEMLALSNAWDTYHQTIGNYATPFVMWGDSQSINDTWRKGVWKANQDNGRVIRRGVVQGVSAEASAAIATRMLADTSYRDHIQIIWAGRNDINNGTQTVDSATILDRVAAMVAAAQARSNKYIVIPPCNGNDQAGTLLANSEATGTAIGTALASLRSTLSSTYGSNYLDLNQKFIDWASDGSASTISGGTSPTANDLTDAGNGITPRSLLTDDIHKNAPGNRVAGYYIEQKMVALGY